MQWFNFCSSAWWFCCCQSRLHCHTVCIFFGNFWATSGFPLVSKIVILVIVIGYIIYIYRSMIPGIGLHLSVRRYHMPTWLGIADREISRLPNDGVRFGECTDTDLIRWLGLSVPAQTVLRRPEIYRKAPVQSRDLRSFVIRFDFESYVRLEIRFVVMVRFEIFESSALSIVIRKETIGGG